MLVPCIVCGYGVGTSTPAYDHIDHIFSEKGKWKKYRKWKRNSTGPGYHFLEAGEIENLYFSGHFGWQEFHRLSKR